MGEFATVLTKSKKPNGLWGNNMSLLWDNAKAHKSAANHLPSDISVVPLPAYSPELNPVERFFPSS
ncbi:MAG: transposase [Planctomycetota bacterium]